MKKLLVTIFDALFPRRPNDAAIAGFSPADFYAKTPRWHGEVYPGMDAIFHYKDRAAKAMVKELKGSRSTHAARIAAFALADRLLEKGIRDAIIIPMPISKKRRKKRGYNQCELIAEFLMRELTARGLDAGFEVRTDILEHPVDTVKFALESRAGRLKAAEGIFRARASLSHIKKRIIVIDDVITTGSTMREAIETLRKAGARNVIGIGLAH